MQGKNRTRPGWQPAFWRLPEAGRLLALMFVAGLVVSAPAQGPFQRQAHLSILNLRVLSQSADGAEVVFRVDYNYDTFGAPPAQLTAVVESRDKQQVSKQFESKPAMVDMGRSFAQLKVRLREDAADTANPLVTDKVIIWASNTWNKSVISVVSFPRSITWSPKGNESFAARSSISTKRDIAATVPAAGIDGPPAQTGAIASALLESIPAAPVVPLKEAEELSGDDRDVIATLAAATTPAKRAAWQERLTLGPGDVMTLSIFGQPELTKTEVFVGPDGRISYLEAQDVKAAGLTIDDLRRKLDEELAKYRRAPSTIITPVTFRSKKYFVLGKVTQKGVFQLDRPTTVIEAVARARGLETSLRDRTLVESADLSRSFLARQGKRVAVDFEKLFQAGDLAQNVSLEPDDYLYFPAGDAKEVYVLGEVRMPGPLGFDAELAAVNAIASRGGFTERAWRSKILVVRGSLNRPEAFVVDATAVLSARAADFKLQPKDIIYVSNRPWIKAEELLEAAASAFVQSVVVTWTGGNIGPIIK
jgi:protein involved in polysaccharide export with SLBB domain